MTWELVNAHCLRTDGMPSLVARSVDVVVTDPPYSAHVHGKSMRGLTVTHKGGAKDEIVGTEADAGGHDVGAIRMSDKECIAELRELLDRAVKVHQWASGNVRHYNDPAITLAQVDRIIEKHRVYGERR